MLKSQISESPIIVIPLHQRFSVILVDAHQTFHRCSCEPQNYAFVFSLDKILACYNRAVWLLP